jgi:hypothetical protein
MKTIIATILLTLSFNAFSSIAFTVSGKLTPNTGADNNLVHMKLITDAGTFKVVSFDHKVQTCENGIFELVNNFHPEDTYSLIEIYDCYDKVEEPVYCPEIYMPICGKFNNEEKTFGNFCELTSSGAEFVHPGDCKN